MEELSDMQLWEELEAFAATYTLQRPSILEMMVFRFLEDPEWIGSNVEGWTCMHYFVGKACISLGNMNGAEENYLSTWALHLFFLPEEINSMNFKTNLYDLAVCLYRQEDKNKRELEILRTAHSIALSEMEAICGPVSCPFQGHRRCCYKYSVD